MTRLVVHLIATFATVTAVAHTACFQSQKSSRFSVKLHSDSCDRKFSVVNFLLALNQLHIA